MVSLRVSSQLFPKVLCMLCMPVMITGNSSCGPELSLGVAAGHAGGLCDGARVAGAHAGRL